MEKKVALTKCNEYDFDKVYAAIQDLFRNAPPPDVKGKVVLLKPNILYPKKPELSICTHPVVVGAAVKSFKELGAAKVLVGESPAIAPSVGAAKSVGMLEQVTANGGEWTDFSERKHYTLENGKIMHYFDAASQLEEADIVVSLSKLKSHQLMSYTGAMKNLFGVLIGLDKAQTHYKYPKKEDFAAFLTDLNLLVDAQYAIMDAIVGMEGPGGPGSGDPIFLGFLAGSQNILALDCVCSSAVGYDPMEITNLKDALERKYWLNSLDEIETTGVPFAEIENKKFKVVHDSQTSLTLGAMMPKFLDKLAKAFFNRNPHFQKDKCIRCGRCIQICPPQTLRFVEDKSEKGKHVEIIRKNCIHCFCCHEICPADAIVLKRF